MTIKGRIGKGKTEEENAIQCWVHFPAEKGAKSQVIEEASFYFKLQSSLPILIPEHISFPHSTH